MSLQIIKFSAGEYSFMLNEVINGRFTNHVNSDTVQKFLIELLGINGNDENKLIAVAQRLKEYIIKKDPINNIFQYLIKSINSNEKNLSDALKNSLLEFSQLLLRIYEELNDPNNPDNLVCTFNPNNAGCTFFNNKLKIFNGYLDFFKHLLSIASISIVNTSGEITHENHARNFFALIQHSSELLGKILIENLPKSSLNDTRKGITDFFSALGDFEHNLGLNHNEAHHIVESQEGYKAFIESLAASFYNSVDDKVNASILTEAIRIYSLHLHHGNVEAAGQHCLDLFSRACLELSVITTPQNIINKTETTKNSAVLSTGLPLPETILTKARVDTTSPAYASQNSTLYFYGLIPIDAEINYRSKPNYPITTLELIAATGHGFGNGFINALLQQLSERLNRSGYSGSRTTAVALNLATILLHSSYAAALPLILAQMQNSDAADENEKNEMLNRITQQVIPTFFTNLGFSLGFQVLNHYQTHYLSGFPTVKAALQSIPVVSTAFAAFSAPIATVVNISAAVASSFLTRITFHFFSPTAENKKSSTLIKTEESKPQESKEKFEMSVNPNKNDSTRPFPNDSTRPFPSVYFMKHEKLVTLKQSLTNIIKELNNMSAVYRQANTIIENHKKNLVTDMNGVIEKNLIISYQTTINFHEENLADNGTKSEIINKQISKLGEYNKLLSDNTHLDACRGFANSEILLKDVNVVNLWALIKVIKDKQIMEKLERNLCSIEGIEGIDSEKLIICPNPKELNKQLRAHISNIRGNSAFVNSVCQASLNLYDAIHQGVTAAKKVRTSYAHSTDKNNDASLFPLSRTDSSPSILGISADAPVSDSLITPLLPLL
jgi:hypothetical protein